LNNEILDLNKIVSDSMKSIKANGYVEKVVTEKLQSCIKNVIDDVFSNYSDFGKSLKKEVEAKISVNLGQLDIAGYNVYVLNAVKEKLDEIIHIQGIEKIKNAMDKMLADIKPEYTLSEIIEALREAEGDSKDYGDRMSLFIEPSQYNTTRIYLDDDSVREKYACKYHIAIHTDTKDIWNVKADDRDFSKNNELGALFGVEELLFKIYATGAKLIIDRDEDDYDLMYKDED
jgi:hypothetical protein